MEAEASDHLSAYCLSRTLPAARILNSLGIGIEPTTPIISGGMNAFRALNFFENLGHGKVMITAGGD